MIRRYMIVESDDEVFEWANERDGIRVLPFETNVLEEAARLGIAPTITAGRMVLIETSDQYILEVKMRWSHEIELANLNDTNHKTNEISRLIRAINNIRFAKGEQPFSFQKGFYGERLLC